MQNDKTTTIMTTKICAENILFSLLQYTFSKNLYLPEYDANLLIPRGSSEYICAKGSMKKGDKERRGMR